MIRIALTGSIGMGKSTVGRMFERAGIPLFDADAVVRELQGPGGALVGTIGERFPGTVSGGLLDRDRLARLVLADAGRLAELEAIVHPAVRDARDQFVEQHAGAAALVFDIPLLFETGQGAHFDKVVVVSAPAEIQRTRALKRPGMTDARLAAILARQTPDSEKRARADFVIDTSGELSTTERQVSAIIACLGLAAGG